MVDSWKVIRGVKYVDISNMPLSYYCGIDIHYSFKEEFKVSKINSFSSDK